MTRDVVRVLSHKLANRLDNWIVERIMERDDLFVSLNALRCRKKTLRMSKMLEKQFDDNDVFGTCKEMISLLMLSEDSALTLCNLRGFSSASIGTCISISLIF